MLTVAPSASAPLSSATCSQTGMYRTGTLPGVCSAWRTGRLDGSMSSGRTSAGCERSDKIKSLETTKMNRN